MRHVVLVGLMGSGKSTVGPALADRLHRPFVDNDATLLRRTGRRARDIAATDGLPVLHRAERDALAASLAAAEPAVIAAAAGAAADADASSLLAGHVVLYLRAEPDVLEARVARSGDRHRPALDLAEQFHDRDPRYRALATEVVDATPPPEDVLAALLSSPAVRALGRS